MSEEAPVYDVFAATAEDQFSQLIDGAAQKVQWARNQAKLFLEHADSLEERAEQYRHLAALMILEGQGYAGEIADLMSSEYPMTDPSDPEEEEEEDESV